METYTIFNWKAGKVYSEEWGEIDAYVAVDDEKGQLYVVVRYGGNEHLNLIPSITSSIYLAPSRQSSTAGKKKNRPKTFVTWKRHL